MGLVENLRDVARATTIPGENLYPESDIDPEAGYRAFCTNNVRKRLTFLVFVGTSVRLPKVATAIRLSLSCFGVISATAKAESFDGWRERK